MVWVVLKWVDRNVVNEMIGEDIRVWFCMVFVKDNEFLGVFVFLWKELVIILFWCNNDGFYMYVIFVFDKKKDEYLYFVVIFLEFRSILCGLKIYE